MDKYKKLNLEVPGIRSVLLDYTKNGEVVNYLDRLGEAAKIKDDEAVAYCLDQLDDWYNKNINNIRTNEFVYNFDSHERERKNIKAIKVLFDRRESGTNNSTSVSHSTTKIFLSHSSKDKRYGDALRNFLINIGIKNDQLIYTSHKLNKIPLGNNIYEFLRDNIDSNVYVIYLLSANYYKSSACLNEMGAAWAYKSNYVCIYTKKFNFSDKQYLNSVIDKNRLGIRLNSPEDLIRISMIELKDNLCKLFNLKVDEKECSSFIGEFIDAINGKKAS